MTYSDLLKLVTRDVRDQDGKTPSMVSDAIYHAIREMQAESECSQYRVRQTAGSGTVNSLTLSPVYGSAFNIEVLRVEAVWRVNADGSFTAIYLSDKFNIQAFKDSGVVLVNDVSLYGNVSLDANSVKLFTPYNMANNVMEFWVRFCNPYIADVFYVTSPDYRAAYIETVPSKYHGALVSGCKFHLYSAMEEKDGFQGKFEKQVKMYFERWYKQDLKTVIQSAAIPVMKFHVSEIVSDGVIREA